MKYLLLIISMILIICATLNVETSIHTISAQILLTCIGLLLAIFGCTLIIIDEIRKK